VRRVAQTLASLITTKPNMNRSLTTALLALASLVAAPLAQAQVTGTATVGIRTLQTIASGWSVKKQVLGKLVYNEEGDQVGRIDDLIVGPNTPVPFVIIGAGGFVGLNRHHVAIPAEQLRERDGTFVLPGATKAVIKALPPFEYVDLSPAQTDAVATPGASRR
jgi:hypothetical protein